MKVTFNEFVDNGLYVASYYLKKEIEAITVTDLKKNMNLLAEEVYKFISCDKYKKVGSMAFYNSSYTQAPSKTLTKEYGDKAKLENIKSQFELLLDNVGNEEYCSICGEKHIKIIDVNEKYIKTISRSLMPNLTSNTFFNHANNLQFVDVCPICLFLSMLSVLNMRKSGNLLMYNSEDQLFMKELTASRQKQNRADVFNDVKEENKGNTVGLQEEIRFFIDEKEWTDKAIMVYVLNNSGQSQVYKDYILTERNLKLFKKVYSNDYIGQFNELNLFRLLLNDTLKYKYINYLVDFKNEKLKCTIEFFDFMENEVSILKKDIRDIIENVCEKIYQVSKKNDISELKSVTSLSAFEELILKYVELYKEEKKENLMTKDDFEKILDYKNWKAVKNRMIFDFITLKED